MSEPNSPLPISELAANRALMAQHEVLHAMLVRSATDTEFRHTLLTNARAACVEYGIVLPPDADIRFVENEHDLTIVLPDPII